ncbi:hypothetical protein RG47T_5262 [Mucilaginibacter polytrichastri]|uniref:Uncharacterized protein n=2 Tax=Mucilaginibacter polytrichastri TaxID=1302689 RepID=A0A1Q5ZRV5_9SPHI|nr:hypothetical protein [Mucilaginibacter polytrichastri]OKS84499.1 hypothetical protein RG47T_5262 [Mucilaginibacter polytrichastri]SFT02986.1 hypothetical protein SAMN04487890_108241 [Mucilaginibacter polytrichastri]SFT23605.1 hypothetical protein SAMN04487890_1214 [Mucilaginibacter polytrichastri]SFT27693.1 hypothetical protein SAMN04487890_1337 [Mucilaginibacter polytrichastri]
MKVRWGRKDKAMKQQIKRRVPITKDNDQWKLHQLFSDFTQKLDRLPDTAAVLRNRRRSAPQGIVPMVF